MLILRALHLINGAAVDGFILRITKRHHTQNVGSRAKMTTMDTDELSNEAYQGIIIEAEKFDHDLTLQFGVSEQSHGLNF